MLDINERINEKGYYGFDIMYHTISGYSYDDCERHGRKFHEMEKKGYVGLTTAGLSKWELREIRRWVKKQKEYIYMTMIEEFDTTDNGGYRDNCCCYWFPTEKLKKDFIEFVDTLPERPYIFEMEPNTAAVAAFMKEEYKNNKRLIDNWDSIIMCFSDQADAMAFKLRWL